ncbi:MAG TPA: hypothetical protein VFO40_23160 [Chthoniobacterales bacterium]|nr:hypothetical protein [Chthoniobacterales bacterium]
MRKKQKAQSPLSGYAQHVIIPRHEKLIENVAAPDRHRKTAAKRWRLRFLVTINAQLRHVPEWCQIRRPHGTFAATEYCYWPTTFFFHLNRSKAGESCHACRFL